MSSKKFQYSVSLVGMCRTGCACGCPGNAMRMRTLPTSCTPWSPTFLSPHAKVRMLKNDFKHLCKLHVPSLIFFSLVSPPTFPNRSADSQCWWELNFHSVRSINKKRKKLCIKCPLVLQSYVDIIVTVCYTKMKIILEWVWIALLNYIFHT